MMMMVYYYKTVVLTIFLIVLVLLTDHPAKGDEIFETLSNTETSEIRSYDGINNNKIYPDWGSANHPRIRSFPTEYSFFDGRDIPLDEINSNLPSARRIMEKIFMATKPHPDKTISHVLLEFGHFVVQDILGSRYNASENFNIPCDGDVTDYVFCPVTGAQAPAAQGSSTSIPFHRDKHIRHPTNNNNNSSNINNSNNNNPRATINGMTSFLDLSNIYGIEEDSGSGSNFLQMKMRHTGGKIALADDNLLVDDYNNLLHYDLKAGVNTSPGAYSIYIVFIRYHNLIAELYSSSHNNATTIPPDAEEIFEFARRQTIAVYQHFVEEKYLPTLLGNKLDPYRGYNPSVDPSIDEFFAAVAFRYAHSSFSNMIRVLDENFQPTPQDPLLLRDVFKNNVPGLVRKLGGIEPFLRGLSITPAKAIDSSLVEDFNVWAEATSVQDVQRGRDVGLPRYNTVREAFGLHRMSTIEELVADRYKLKYKDNNNGNDNDGEPDDYLNDSDYLYLVQALKELYHDDVDLVDAYVGALIESPLDVYHNLGPVMALSIQNQFQRLRDGDRYWYKNLYDQEVYENKFPDLAKLIKMVCEGMDSFTDDPYVVTPTNPTTADDGACSSAGGGSTNQLSLLGGDYNVRWHLEENNSADKTIEVKLSIQEEMVGPGYLGIGWEKTAMKGAHIWFCTVNEDALMEYIPTMPSHCSAAGGDEKEDGTASQQQQQQQQQLSIFSCCLALGTNHLRPECSKPDDDLFYPLEVIDWCISTTTSSVTVKAPVCSSSDETANTIESSSGRSCFQMESTDDGAMDFIVAYNTIDNSRPHGYQRRTNAQVDLTAGLLTQSEASTADDGLIATHGAFMLFGWMILAPLGVFIVRYFKTWEKRLVAHISIMGAVGSMMMPLLIGVEASVGATDKTQQHAVVGLIVMCFFFVMAGTGRFRYLKWEGHKIGRKTDFISLLVHKYGGAVFIGLAWWNCYTGLCRIGPEDSEFQLVLFSNLHLGYDIQAFGTIKDYVYGPYVACVVLVFILAEIRLIRMANASQSAMKSGKGLWGDEDDSYLDTMTLETFLDVTRIGNSLCVVDGRVLDISSFIDIHPGGPELLRYVRGSDITEEFVGARDVDGIKHVHSQGAIKLMKKFVKAKLIDGETGHVPKGRGSFLPGLAIMKEFLQGERHMSQPFRRGKVLDVKFVAPSGKVEGETKPVILLQLALPRTIDQLQEKNMTKLPGCSFRFRGIDKDGLMFEREYTAVSLDRHLSQDTSLASPFGSTTTRGTSQISLRQLDAMVDSSSLRQKSQENRKKDEVYDFVISLIPGGKMSEFFKGLKTGKLLLAQGPKVNPQSVYTVKSTKWRSVVMFAAGTGVVSMLQIIDFYLEEQRVIGGHCPMLYLVWVLKSPAHNYHEDMNLKGRLRKARGRLRWITVYSASKEGSPEEDPEVAHSLGSNKAAVRLSVGGAGTPRRTTSAPARVRRRAVVPRFRTPKRCHSADDHTEYEEPTNQPSVRTSVFASPSTALPLPLPPYMFRPKHKTRMNVKDLIDHVREQGISVCDLSFLGEDKRVRLEQDFWHKSPRQMTRHLDRRMLKELLHSMQNFTSEYRRKQQRMDQDLSDSANSLHSKEGDFEETTEPRSIAAFLRENVPIQDRKDGMRLHKECFVASEAIDYLVGFGLASSREHAECLGRVLQEQKLIQHVSVGCAFSDCGEFFRFPPVPEASLATSSELPAIGEDEIDLSSPFDGGVDPFESGVDHTRTGGSYSQQPYQSVSQQSGPSQRPFLDRSEAEMWMDEDMKIGEGEGGRSNPFKGTLVAVSGSPLFEVDIVDMLKEIGVPREQIMTFVASKK